MQILDQLLGALPAGLVLAVVGALVLAEAALLAGLVLPSATALVALGLLANEQVVGIVPAVLVAVGAALLGGTAGFVAGRRRGPRVRWVKEKHWQRAERIFTRHGGRAVFFGQWVVGARTLVPRLAGMNGVPYRRFAAWHSPAAVGWAVWLVVGSYLAGASYDVLAARAGRAGGALAVLTALLIGLALAGRWLGSRPVSSEPWRRSMRLNHPLIVRLWSNRTLAVAASTGLLGVLAVLLLLVIPLIVKFSGLSAADQAVAGWARGQWTSDGYLFALDLATSVSPEALLGGAVVVALARAWWRREKLFDAVIPLLPMAVLVLILAIADPPSWQGPPDVFFPSVLEFDGPLPLGDAAPALAGLASGATAQLAAVVGLLAWLLARRRSWPWRVTVGTVAAAGLTVCAGSWVYLGWSHLSATIAAVLLGVAWAVLNAAIWASRSPGPPPVPARAELEHALG
ncbi:VTT domain-containing protein [Actinoplanes solisilvae]|uniref:VTT domain-containing protein n=1 Tax=Actinoplanes solisilvae TaxID=2486853 RepID=UPI000FDC8BC0|nr:VTT domain-containing protein [Actinoplanes solisilvae]